MRGGNFVGLGVVWGRFWIRLAFVNSAGLAVRKAGRHIWEAFSLVGLDGTERVHVVSWDGRGRDV